MFMFFHNSCVETLTLGVTACGYRAFKGVISLNGSNENGALIQ